MSEADETDLDRELERFFAAGRAAAPAPSEALMARVLAGAEAVQGGAAPAEVAVAPAPGGLGRLVAALGGWPALAGLATAAMTGLWIGAAAPEMVASLTGLGGGAVAADAGYDMGDLGFAGLALAGDL
jgi:hypothetical protein